MGFLDFFKKKADTNMNEKVQAAASEVKKAGTSLGGGDLLSRFNEAQEKFKKDQDLNGVIQELEDVFWKGGEVLKSPKCLDLMKYYLQAGKTDTAREYLSYLQENSDLPVEEFRLAEARILKGEGNWTDAIAKYLAGYLLTAERTGKLKEDKLQNDIKSSIKKQGWSEASMDGLIAIVRKHVNKKDFREESLEADIRKFIAKLA